MNRRELLKHLAVAGGGLAAYQLAPAARAFAGSQADAAALSAMRRQLAATPIEVTKLTNLITMFSGPGGNVVVRHGEEGKVVVDTFVQGAFDPLKTRLDALGDTPVLHVINTHWHFDHTDNNAAFRALGAELIAHENTRGRLSEPHELLGMRIDPAPAEALPTRAVRHHHLVRFDLPFTEEYIDIGRVPPAHTDTDVYVHFPMGDVLALGDLFFNGSYPLIDAGTGGRVMGMIAAVDDALRVVNPGTRIVPGHGPVADREALEAYRTMLAAVTERVQKLKAAGMSVGEAVARRPSAEFDATWGGGFIAPDVFVSMVYSTL